MTATAGISTGTWTVDAVGTTAGFAARGLGHTVHGTIAVSAGTIDVDADGRPLRLYAALDPASVDTGNARRDADLRGKRFFRAADHPTMDVVADRIDATTGGWRAQAVLRVAGVEAPLHIDGTLDGAPSDMALRVTGTARLDRRSVGIRVPGFMVGRYVDITVTARLIRLSG